LYRSENVYFTQFYTFTENEEIKCVRNSKRKYEMKRSILKTLKIISVHVGRSEAKLTRLKSVNFPYESYVLKDILKIISSPANLSAHLAKQPCASITHR
ncbi:hypothetical protein T11_12825, partial [Trichinella zimbabwensis]